MEIHNLIDGCVAMEKAVSSIYSTFMRLFPEEKDFWGDLCKDELEHSSFLNNSDYQKILNRGLQITMMPPSKSLIERTLDLAGKINKQIQFETISPEDAFKMALKLEESMVETFANEFIANLIALDDKKVVETILAGERLHVDKIREMMIKKGYLKLM
jgi:hypothetical protein